MLISVETKESSYEVNIPDSLTTNVLDPMKTIVWPVLDSARDYIFSKEGVTVQPKFTMETIDPNFSGFPEPKITPCSSHKEAPPDPAIDERCASESKEVAVVVIRGNYRAVEYAMMHTGKLIVRRTDDYPYSIEEGIPVAVIQAYKDHSVADNICGITRWYNTWNEADQELKALEQK